MCWWHVLAYFNVWKTYGVQANKPVWLAEPPDPSTSIPHTLSSLERRGTYFSIVSQCSSQFINIQSVSNRFSSTHCNAFGDASYEYTAYIAAMNHNTTPKVRIASRSQRAESKFRSSFTSRSRGGCLTCKQKHVRSPMLIPTPLPFSKITFSYICKGEMWWNATKMPQVRTKGLDMWRVHSRPEMVI